MTRETRNAGNAGNAGNGDLLSHPISGGEDLAGLTALLAACAEDEDTDYTLRKLIATRHSDRVTDGAVTGRVWRRAGAAIDRIAAVAVATTRNVTFHVHPTARSAVLEDAVMDWIDRQLLAAATLDPDTRFEVTLRPGADRYRAALLERHRYTRVERVTRRMRRRLDDPERLPRPQLPPGYTVRPLHDEAEIARFVALFRDAFGAGPTVTRRRQFWRQPSHLRELVVEAADGTFVAFCYCEVGASTQMPLAAGEGSISQLGTARAFRRRGFGRAALRAGLHQLRERGMRWAVMQTGGTNEPSHRLFESEGFETFETVPRLRYVKRAVDPIAA